MNQDLDLPSFELVSQFLDLHQPESSADGISGARFVDLTKAEHWDPVPLVNVRLYIPGLRSVDGFDGGINLALLDINKDRGLLCILLPYLNMQEFDFIELFYGNDDTAVAVHTLSASEAAAGSSTALYVPRTRVRDGIVELFFRVTQVFGNVDETLHWRLLVDTHLPGGRNPVASTFENENLPKPVLPQHLIDFGVLPGDTDTPIAVRLGYYPHVTVPSVGINRAAGDLLRLHIGGYPIEHTVTEDEAKGLEPVTVYIKPDDWYNPDTDTGIRSGEHLCGWVAIDNVGNYSDGWSPEQRLLVRLDDSADPLLPEAYVEESDENNELDADALDGADATIVVLIHQADFERGDSIRIELNGRTSEGVPVVSYIVHDILDSEFGRAARISWPNADILPLIKGRVQITYSRIRPSVPDRDSRSVIVHVTGIEAGTGLPPPQVDGAPGDVLPPEIAFLIVTIKTYLGQEPFDLVTLVLDGTLANGQPYYRAFEEVAGNSDIIFRMQNGANGEIARLEGGTLRLYYFVENAAGKRISRELSLDVGAPQASLPPVQVDQAPPPDQVFDPEVWPYDARTVIKAHTDIKEGDLITFHAEGSVVGGGAPPQTFEVSKIWEGRDLPFTLLRNFILPNLDRVMRLYYTLTRTGQRIRYSHAFVMKVGSALELSVPEVLEGSVTGPDSTTIDPMRVINPPNITVRVKYAMQANDEIKLRWHGMPGLGTPDITPKAGNPSQGYVDFTHANTVVAANLAKTSEVFFEVKRGGAVSASKRLKATVQALPDSALGLVSVPEAVGGVIDAGRVNNILITQWPFMRVGQALWIYLRGESDYVLRAGSPVTTTEFNNKQIRMQIPATYLAGLSDQGQLEVDALVSLDGSGVQISALRLVKPRYSIKKAARIIGHIDVGGSPQEVIFAPDGRRVYVANYSSNTVSVIDTTTDKVIHTITELSSPSGLTVLPDGSRLYVGNRGANTVSVINTVNHSIIATIPSVANPYGLTTNSSGTQLYIASHNSHFVYVYATATNTRLASIGVTNAKDVAFNRNGTRLYAMGGPSANSLFIIDPTVNKVISRIEGLNNPNAVACSPFVARAYVTNSGTGSVSIFDTDTNRLIKTLTGYSYPRDVVFNPVKEEAYLSRAMGNELRVIDTRSETVVGTIKGFSSPFHIAVSPDGRKAYVSNRGSHTLAIVIL
ncbi:YncE family protein [Pseudomonas farris]